MNMDKDMIEFLKSLGAKKHYEDMAMLIYEDRLAMPHIDVLLDEMLELKIVSDKKVDHPRKKSKDLSDAVCGSVYNAMTLTQRHENKTIEIHDFNSNISSSSTSM